MVGYLAHALDDAIAVDGDEVVEARWSTRDEVAALADAGRLLESPDAIGLHLVRTWREGGASSPS